jgi:hypothetical protein
MVLSSRRQRQPSFVSFKCGNKPILPLEGSLGSKRKK